jgi:hypothetical protein
LMWVNLGHTSDAVEKPYYAKSKSKFVGNASHFLQRRHSRQG